MPARVCRSFRLGPWVGAWVALLRSPILRPGQFRYSMSFGNHLGAQHVRLRLVRGTEVTAGCAYAAP